MSAVIYKKIAFLAPRADLTREAFLSYWEKIHGPVVASAPDYGRWRRRYVQNHIVSPGPIGRAPDFGGMAMFWLPGANEDEYGLTSTYRDHIRPDELNFIDMDSTVSMTATEEILRPGDGPVKLVILVPREALGSVDQRLRQSAAVRGHRVNHVLEGSMRLPGARPVSGPEIAQVHEVWFKSPDDFSNFSSSRSADYLNCEGDGRIVSFTAREHVFFSDGKPC